MVTVEQKQMYLGLTSAVDNFLIIFAVFLFNWTVFI